MDLKIQKGISLWWGTPIIMFIMPDHQPLNEELKRLILQRKADSSGIKKSNLGGWHSKDDLLTWPSPAVGKLQEGILSAFKRITDRTGAGQTYEGPLRITCWANVNGLGHANDIHNHPQCAWSGVYYVDVGTDIDDTQRSGFLHFMDPRGGAGMVQDPFHQFGRGRELKPKNGQLVMFPSWLMHGVHTYRGKGERISIAFNVVLQDLM